MNDNPTDWNTPGDLAAILGEPPRRIGHCGYDYTEGGHAMLPIARKSDARWRADYVYRYDDEATWRGTHLQQISRVDGWSRRRIVETLELSRAQVDRTILDDTFIGLRHQQAVADLYEAVYVPADGDDTWWAVCDVVLDRLVVSTVHEKPSTARRVVDNYRSKGACRGVIVRGSGDRPEVGLRIRERELEEVDV